MNWTKNPNDPGGRLHHHGGELIALNSKKSRFHGFCDRLLIIMPFTSIATSATAAPRIEIYTTLACSIHRPDIFGESSQQLDILDFVQPLNNYRIPAAHQSGSIDMSDAFMIGKSLQFKDADTPPTRKQRCASDPVVQAAVAKLITSVYSFLSFYTSMVLSPSMRFLKRTLSLRFVG